MGTEPSLRQSAVLGLASYEVEQIDTETDQHEHLHVEAVPVGPQVKGDLSQQQTVLQTFLQMHSHFIHE